MGRILILDKIYLLAGKKAIFATRQVSALVSRSIVLLMSCARIQKQSRLSARAQDDIGDLPGNAAIIGLW